MWHDAAKVLTGALAGTFLCVAIARYVIAKSLEDLETALKMVNELNLKLAVIANKVERVERIADVVLEHDRKIIALEQNRRAARN
jgi:hypothetical protein